MAIQIHTALKINILVINMRWSRDNNDASSHHPGGSAIDRLEYMSNLPRDADYWNDEY